ncbi:ANTAR domain-containing protein [Allosaccharopolyspora coralli]|nr:ANTAR domain-containing protein [Allosaccharopolyspora coralli]
MQRDNVTGQQAFDRLVRASQHANIKLVDVARWLIDGHEQPGETDHPRTH